MITPSPQFQPLLKLSASGITRLELGGEKRDFAVRLAELRRIQELTGRGPHKVLNDLRNGEWLIDDVIEIIRLGLEAAGTEPSEASALVNRYIIEPQRFLSIGRSLAMAILINGLEAPDDDAPKKSQKTRAKT